MTRVAFKLAIDPGHGFSNAEPGVYDPGAIAGGATEAEIVIAWALTGKWVLEQSGIPYWLSRDDDRDVAPLGTRDERAVAAGCTHFLSLHCNTASSDASGTEIFVRDTADARFAALVLGAATAALGLPDRGVKNESESGVGRLSVLDFPGPAALLELGFISSAADRARLLSREVRLEFWRRLAVALMA